MERFSLATVLRWQIMIIAVGHFAGLNRRLPYGNLIVKYYTYNIRLFLQQSDITQTGTKAQSIQKYIRRKEKQ